MFIQIRPAVLTDADSIAAVHVESIHSLGAKVYGADVISAWGAPRDGERYRRAMKGGELFFVAVSRDDRDWVLGFSAYRFEDGKHRTAIYVRGAAARMGVGTALFQAAETAAKEHGAAEIHVSASLAAVEFYKGCGFEELTTAKHHLKNGTPMDCVLMRKRLVSS
jgi:ribosomal protein S18 acetylase RimI-like enzyme